jgi:PAS domain S-box-containing protein
MNTMFNKLLQQQLREHLGDPGSLPVNLQDLLKTVSASYDLFEKGRKGTGKSIGISSKKMTKLNETLHKEQEELRRMHQELKTLFEDINEVLYSVDMVAYKLTHISAACERVYGYTCNEFYKDPALWQKVIHPDDIHISKLQLEALYKGEQVVNQYRVIHKNSGVKWIENKIIPTIDEKNTLIRIDGVTSDITAQKEAQQRIIESEERYRGLFEQNLAGVYRTTSDGKILACNMAFATMLGYSSPQEVLKLNSFDLYFSPGERDLFIYALRDAGKLYNYEAVLRQKNGTEVHVIENVSLHKNLTTGEELCDGVMIDVTKRKKAEQVLAESNKRLEEAEILGNMGHWQWDLTNNTVTWSAGQYRVFDLGTNEFGGRFEDVMKLFHPDDVKHAEDMVTRLIETGQTEPFEFRIIRSDGSIRHIIGTGKTNTDSANKVVSVFGTTQDITDIKLAEARIKESEIELELKNAELQQKNKELEQFAYVASHDLQEPLRTISSFVNLLRDQYLGKLDERADKYSNFILQSCERMKALINDLLDYSRIGHKKLAEQVDCGEMLGEVLADLGIAIDETQAEIKTAQLPVIRAYPTEMKQLFQNLITNAIKFRKKDVPPRVEISAEQADAHWKFTVKDNGIGIEEKHKERVFVIFQRLHTRTEYEGSGIGLAHCKKIVELHGGRIWIESNPQEGTSFHFTVLQNYN